MHLIEWGGKRVLFDCGLCQGHRKEAFERNRNPAVDAQTIDALVLSHAHIDHSGNIPTLVKRGFRGPIYATPATVDLCDPMLYDSAHIQEHDVAYVNRKRERQGKNPFEPLYVRGDVARALEQFRAVPYGDGQELAPGLTLTFHDAGHILGSAVTCLDFEEDGRESRLFLTGDLGRPDMPILRDPFQVETADYVVSESTYGDREHPAQEDVKAELERLVADICRSGGKLIIPSFSVGRTQTLVYFLHELFDQERIPDVPIYVDSPLSFKATRVFRTHVECYDAEAWRYMIDGESPFSFETLRYVVDVEDSKAINAKAGPMIIISASGMCEGGRILHHLKHTIEDPNSVVLFVGYQAANTLGRRLKEGESPVKIFGELYEVSARVAHIEALSAHADREEMVSYFAGFQEKPRSMYLVHGEEDQTLAFAERLRSEGYAGVEVPSPGQSVELQVGS
jgi:metallo-beta-lactamase family protein